MPAEPAAGVEVLPGLSQPGGHVRFARGIGSEPDPDVLGLCDLLACEEADAVDCCERSSSHFL